MALTRARVVAGPPMIRARVNQAIRDVLLRSHDPGKIRGDAVAMRIRMAKELRPHGPWDVKLRLGGLIDIEFIAQILQLIHNGASGFHGSQTTRVTLHRLSEAGFLDRAHARLLIEAEHLWRTIQGMLRMTVGPTDAEALPLASAEPLLHAAAKAGIDAVDAIELLNKSDMIAQQVRSLFELYVGALN